MASLDFYDAGLLRQVATNLFYGWGYNFYNTENQMRTDDLLVRTKAAWLLGLAATAVREAEAEYRREFLPPPSRVKPFPDAAAVAEAQRLEKLAGTLSALQGAIHQQPAPGSDRMTQRHWQEKATLTSLLKQDEALVGRCELLRQAVCGNAARMLLTNLPAITIGIDSIRTALRDRESVLHAQWV